MKTRSDQSKNGQLLNKHVMYKASIAQPCQLTIGRNKKKKSLSGRNRRTPSKQSRKNLCTTPDLALARLEKLFQMNMNASMTNLDTRMEANRIFQ